MGRLKDWFFEEPKPAPIASEKLAPPPEIPLKEQYEFLVSYDEALGHPYSVKWKPLSYDLEVTRPSYYYHPSEAEREKERPSAYEQGGFCSSHYSSKTEEAAIRRAKAHAKKEEDHRHRSQWQKRLNEKGEILG